MGIKEKNISAMVDYFESGCKKEQLFGVELEHFVVDKNTHASLAYENGVEKILTQLQPIYGTPFFSQGRIIGVSHAETATHLGTEITLEPAAQLEISINPSANIKKIRNTYEHFVQTITPLLDAINCELFCTGFQPKSKISELKLIPKPRYALMHDYFKTVGTMGEHMMKGSAATQINIDYESEEDFAKKFRVANILGPIFSFVYDNTPHSRMFRTQIWNDVDPARSMVVNGALDKKDTKFGFHEYANYILQMPPIFIMRDGETVSTGNKTVSEVFANQLMSPDNIDHVLSMAFPDVRLKNRIEIRIVDSLPIEKTLEFTSLIKNIFYHKNTLDKFYNETENIKNHDVTIAKTNLINHGANAEIYGKPADYWISKIDIYKI